LLSIPLATCWTTTGQGGSVIEYAKSQLAKLPSFPTVSLTANLSWPIGIMFDSAGNLWAADYNGQTVSEFSPVQLRKTGHLARHPTIHEPYGGPCALAIGP
jgi:DNA-binding beta-propeller fold protein YncE